MGKIQTSLEINFCYESQQKNITLNPHQKIAINMKQTLHYWPNLQYEFLQNIYS